jgi:LCP family protein required for cell wall assembly
VTDRQPPGRTGRERDADAPPPEYNLYRSRRKPLGGTGDLDALRKRLSRRSEGRPRPPREPGKITPGRVIRWIAFAVVGWLLLSFVLFLVSAQIQSGVPDDAKRTLAGGGSLLSGSTILVLGSDARGGDSIDQTQSGPARADSIMLVHVAFGSVRKLSIPRDSLASIPGHDDQKINAAYAFGGAALMIQTVEGFMGNGIRVNHLIEVDFEHFPELIDALGGIDVNVDRRICSPPFDNFWKGLRFRRGEQHLDGTEALGFSRIRKNSCQPSESDVDRAARQQKVLDGISGKVKSPSTFFRLPWVSWKAPQALRTDLKGPGLLALFTDLATSGAGDTHVLEPSCLGCGPGGSLVVSDGAKADAARALLDG